MTQFKASLCLHRSRQIPQTLSAIVFLFFFGGGGGGRVKHIYSLLCILYADPPPARLPAASASKD